ncbi:MAG TPA: hypothetical protein V6D13_06385 [Halomicronema sp.]
MNTTKNPKLQQNPFQTYRDPHTGRWVVITSQDNLIKCQLNPKTV